MVTYESHCHTVKVLDPTRQVPLQLGAPSAFMLGFPTANVGLLASVDGRKIENTGRSKFECHSISH